MKALVVLDYLAPAGILVNLRTLVVDARETLLAPAENLVNLHSLVVDARGILLAQVEILVNLRTLVVDARETLLARVEILVNLHILVVVALRILPAYLRILVVDALEILLAPVEILAYCLAIVAVDLGSQETLAFPVPELHCLLEIPVPDYFAVRNLQVIGGTIVPRQILLVVDLPFISPLPSDSF